jgi:tetratricopeptide (TPR) repeat protein
MGLLSQPAHAASWTQATAAHIELLTDCDHDLAKGLLQLLCRAQAFLPSSRFGKAGRERSLRVIVFDSAEDFRRWAPSKYASAYYLSGNRRDIIVLYRESAQQTSVVLHEFTHYAVHGSGLQLPPWLKEGLAEYYSTAQLDSNEVVYGGISSSRIDGFRRQPGLPLSTLLAETSLNAAYQNATFLKHFYARSAALTALLEESLYAKELPLFLHTVSGSGDSAGAFANIYHKNLVQVDDELSKYIEKNLEERSSVKRESLHVAIKPDILHFVPDLERDLALAEICLDQGWTRFAAAGMLDRLRDQFAPECDLELLWGDLEWLQGARGASREHYSRAVAAGAADAKTLFRLAQLEQEAGAEVNHVCDLLDKSLKANPEHQGARYRLALIQVGQDHWQAAQSNLEKIYNVRPEWGFNYKMALAYCAFRKGEVEKAFDFATQARSAVRGPKDTQQCNDFFARLPNATPKVASR